MGSIIGWVVQGVDGWGLSVGRFGDVAECVEDFGFDDCLGFWWGSLRAARWSPNVVLKRNMAVSESDLR